MSPRVFTVTTNRYWLLTPSGLPGMVTRMLLQIARRVFVEESPNVFQAKWDKALHTAMVTARGKPFKEYFWRLRTICFGWRGLTRLLLWHLAYFKLYCKVSFFRKLIERQKLLWRVYGIYCLGLSTNFLERLCKKPSLMQIRSIFLLISILTKCRFKHFSKKFEGQQCNQFPPQWAAKLINLRLNELQTTGVKFLSRLQLAVISCCNQIRSGSPALDHFSCILGINCSIWWHPVPDIGTKWHQHCVIFFSKEQKRRWSQFAPLKVLL